MRRSRSAMKRETYSLNKNEYRSSTLHRAADPSGFFCLAGLKTRTQSAPRRASLPVTLDRAGSTRRAGSRKIRSGDFSSNRRWTKKLNNPPGFEYKRFSGLRSLWATFMSCRCFTATQISYIISAASETIKEKNLHQRLVERSARISRCETQLFVSFLGQRYAPSPVRVIRNHP